MNTPLLGSDADVSAVLGKETLRQARIHYLSFFCSSGAQDCSIACSMFAFHHQLICLVQSHFVAFHILRSSRGFHKLIEKYNVQVLKLEPYVTGSDYPEVLDCHAHIDDLALLSQLVNLEELVIIRVVIYSVPDWLQNLSRLKVSAIEPFNFPTSLQSTLT